MKIQIDTDNKVVKFDSKENLGKLFILLEKMLENWKEYDIETNTTITYWNNPIVIDRYPHYPQPHYPYFSTGGNTANVTSDPNWTLCAHNTSEEQIGRKLPRFDSSTKGLYNLEVN